MHSLKIFDITLQTIYYAVKRVKIRTVVIFDYCSLDVLADLDLIEVYYIRSNRIVSDVSGALLGQIIVWDALGADGEVVFVISS